jgi:hypothetical protein
VQCGHVAELRADGADANGVEIAEVLYGKGHRDGCVSRGSAAYEHPIKKGS